MSDVLREAPHTARFRDMVLPEVCCLEQVKFVDGLPCHVKPQEDRLDMGAGHSISFRNKTAADRCGRRDRKEEDRTSGNRGQSQRKVGSWEAFQGTCACIIIPRGDILCLSNEKRGGATTMLRVLATDVRTIVTDQSVEKRPFGNVFMIGVPSSAELL